MLEHALWLRMLADPTVIQLSKIIATIVFGFRCVLRLVAAVTLVELGTLMRVHCSLQWDGGTLTFFILPF
jgi:hypothetical protein